jgi:hypothetical protein
MYLAIKWALVSFPPFYQMGSQFLVAGAVLGACAPARAPRGRGQRVARGAVMGTLLISGGYGFMASPKPAWLRLGGRLYRHRPTMVVLGEWPYGVRPDRRQALASPSD